MVWLRSLVFGTLFAGTSLVFIPYRIVGARLFESLTPDPVRIAGLWVAGAGLVLMLWCWGVFAGRGRGTPAPFDPPRAMVGSGPYAHVRNPMYIAAVLVLIGEALLARSWALLAYAATFAALAHVFVVAYEEPTLRRTFGADYERYCEQVPRWLPRRRALD